MVTAWLKLLWDRSAAVRRVWRLVVNLDRHDAWRAANAITFDAFLSVIPLLAIAGYVLHRLNQSGDIVLGPILRTAPPAIARLADTEFLRLSEKGAFAMAPISVTGFLWVSSSGLSTTMGVFDVIYKAEPRTWYQRRLIAIGLVILGLAVVAITAAATVGVVSVTRSETAPTVAVVLPTLVLTGAVAGFFRIAIRRPDHVRRRFIPGALVTVVLWAVVSILFSAYIRVFPRYATFYGSLAAVAILAFWLWLLSLSLLVGGEVNADLEGIRDPDTTDP